jgi:von Willebrand factor type A domain
MIKACALTATGVLIFSLGCGADKGGTGGNDPFGNGGKGGAFGTGTGIFGTSLKPGTGSTSGTDTGGEGDATCGQKNFDLQRLPPEVLVVQDRSGSMMRNAMGNAGNPTKWSETTNALNGVFAQTDQSVLWGIQLYPTCMATGMGPQGLNCDPTPCTINGLSMAPMIGQAAQLTSLLGQNTPTIDTGATPTAGAVRLATQALMARSTPNPKFILLSTDGEPNCLNHDGSMSGGGSLDPEGAIAAVTAARAAGIETFVIGLATQAATATLNQLAEAGGRPQTGAATKYYSVSNGAALTAALASITGLVQNCTFPLGTAPPPGSTVVVQIDGTTLGMNDWQYGAGSTSVIVTGAWCDKLKTDKAKTAAIKYRCDGLPIE